jgi:hypothetical protein
MAFTPNLDFTSLYPTIQHFNNDVVKELKRLLRKKKLEEIERNYPNPKL